MSGIDIFGIWLAAGLTLVIFSFVYKDNPVFKVGEHIYLGVSLGYGTVIVFWNNVKAQVWDPLTVQQDFWVLIPVMLGMFIILRVVPSLAWLSRIAFAVYIAGFAGFAIPNEINGKLLPQIGATMAPITGLNMASFNALIVLIGVFTTVVFFFFSTEHKGVVGRVSRLGVLFVMVSFGASFGYTVMARVSLLIGRFQFLIDSWWGQAIMGGGA